MTVFNKAELLRLAQVQEARAADYAAHGVPGEDEGYQSIRTLSGMHVYLKRTLGSFVDDPADSGFQQGFQAALREMQKMLAPSS